MNGAEIEQKRAAPRAEMDVSRLDVQVQLSFGMDQVQGVQYWGKNREKKLGAELSVVLLDIGSQIFPLLKIHHQIACLIGQEEGAYSDDIRMAKGREYLGLEKEESSSVVEGVGLRRVRQGHLTVTVAGGHSLRQILLDNDLMIGISISREIDHAKATAAYQTLDRVAVDDGPRGKAISNFFHSGK